MDDGVFPPPIMDLDFMDELLLEGCWLQATDGSEFLNNNSPSTSANPVFDPAFLWPSLDPYNNLSILPKDIQEERQRSSFPENLSISQAQGDEVSQSLITKQPLVQGSDLNRRWWIGPRAEPGPSLSVMERLMRALENIKHYSRDKDVLVQVWLPLNSGGKKILSTSHQPFSLDLNSPKLASYRNISENYQFPADEDSKEVVGLPGRVFTSKVPEWTPDVRLFRTEEFPRVVHAQQYGVRGSLAVPVFDQGSKSCLGVIEVVTTAQKSNYGPEIQSVCKALEAVDLRSSEASGTEKVVLTQASDGSYQAALPEILEILKCACETHNLPLAQTWVPCIQQGKSGCRHSDSNLIHCISTVDSACYVSSPEFKDFQEACSEHHLLKGQGLVGKAFMTNQPCFSPDVTSYTKTEYPLSHHARISGLCAGVAIRLRSTYTANTDHVLEFFLPVDCKKPEEQKEVLNSLSVIIQKMCGSLRTVTEDELNQEKASIHIQPSSDDEVTVLEEKKAAMPEKKGKEILTEKSGELGQNSGSSVFLNEGKKVENKRKAKAEKTITLQMLRQYFAGSLKDAAKQIGVCPTTLKRICRQHGIQRWPSRKIKKVGHSLQKIQRVMDSVQGASGAFQIDSFYSNFPDFASPPPNASTATQSPPPAPPNAATELIEAVLSKSLSPSCSQSSSSSHSCSNGTHLSTMQANGNGPEGPGDPITGVLKRARSDAQLHITKPENPDQQYALPRSQSHKSLGEIGEGIFPVKSQMTRPPKPRSSRRGDHVQRIKVTYGEEKVRFRMQNEWGFEDLLREVAKRFSINDISNGGFQLKYLDDDSEWVLLTCDADVEECIDVCRLSNTGTIKLSLRDAQNQIGSSLGSNGPL